MDLATVIGLVLIAILLLFGMGFNVGPFIDLPSMAIVAGGAAGAIMMSYPLGVVAKMPVIFKQAFLNSPPDLTGLITTLVSFSEKARREGLLALEGDIETVEDVFLKKGVQLIVDGTDPELVKNILDSEVTFIAERHDMAKGVMKTGAAMAPAYGMIGTLIGLILMLGNLSDPSSLGPSMAIALITTLYGSMIANIIFDPIANKLEYYSGQEILSKLLVIEGTLAIQSGDNPKVLEEKLKSFLSPGEREAIGKKEGE